MSNTPTPDPFNPAAAKQGAIPAGGSSQGKSFAFAGIPQNFLPGSGKLPKPVKDPKTGAISYTYYDLNLDANVIYQSMSPEVRKTVFTGLAQKGLYGSSSPNRNPDTDKRVLSDLLLYANIAGLEWQKAYEDYVKNVPNSSGGKKAPSVRVTSPDDLKVVFRKASTDLLGYEVDDATAKRFAQSYRQLEITEGQRQAAGGVFESAAAPSTVAEQQILKQFKPEAQSFAAGNLASIMDQSIKALGA